jgi:hypothetical protein
MKNDSGTPATVIDGPDPALTTCTIRQPSGRAGMTKYPSSAANMKPYEKKPAS